MLIMNMNASGGVIRSAEKTVFPTLIFVRSQNNNIIIFISPKSGLEQ